MKGAKASFGKRIGSVSGWWVRCFFGDKLSFLVLNRGKRGGGGAVGKCDGV